MDSPAPFGWQRLLPRKSPVEGWAAAEMCGSLCYLQSQVMAPTTCDTPCDQTAPEAVRTCSMSPGKVKLTALKVAKRLL